MKQTPFIPPQVAREIRAAHLTPSSFEATPEIDRSVRSDMLSIWDAKNAVIIPGEYLSDRSSGPAARVASHAYACREILGSVEFPDVVLNYGLDFCNAYFDGSYLIFGSGDGFIFNDFSQSVDIFAHELGHSIVSSGPSLGYTGTAGALNEHLCDVIAISVKQYAKGMIDDFKIGSEVFFDRSLYLRDMLNPGKALHSPVTGRDPQVGHMNQYRVIRDETDGAHINSGIPNRAFALTCTYSGKPSWSDPLKIWRQAMGDISAESGFRDFACATVRHSGDLGPHVRRAWNDVGILI